MRRNRRYSRRAFSLVQLITLLPVIGAITTVGYQLTDRMLRLEGQIGRQVTEEAGFRDVLRRVQADAAGAESASIDGGKLLTLEQADRTVVYEARDNRVTRTERVKDKPPVVYHWKAHRFRVSFEAEKIGAGPGLVWVRWIRELPGESGPDRIRRLSAAATVGTGGAS